MTEEEPKGKEGKFKESETVEQGPSQPPKTRRDSQTTFDLHGIDPKPKHFIRNAGEVDVSDIKDNTTVGKNQSNWVGGQETLLGPEKSMYVPSIVPRELRLPPGGVFIYCSHY